MFILWFLWGMILILLEFSGSCYKCKNEKLFQMVSDISFWVNFVSFIPVLPFLWCKALKKSIEEKLYKWIVFNIITILISIMIWISCLTTDMSLIRGL